MSIDKHSVNCQFWASRMVEQICKISGSCISHRGKCSIMLTGGHTASMLYDAWAKCLRNSADLENIEFFFGDERCVPADDPESNYCMAMERLFPAGVPNTVRIHRLEADSEDLERVANCYSTLLPEAIDILLLTVGMDGHVASLFPYSAALHETHRRVVSVTGPKPPYKRLTVTPAVILGAREVFVMALGRQKQNIYERALQNPGDIDSIPARLVLSKTWIFGD